MLLSEELLLPAFSLSKELFQGDLGDQTQLSGFWAYGDVRDKKIAADTVAPPNLESVGLGLRFVVGRYLNFRANYGWQLRELPGATSHGHFAHVALTLAYWAFPIFAPLPHHAAARLSVFTAPAWFPNH